MPYIDNPQLPDREIRRVMDAVIAGNDPLGIGADEADLALRVIEGTAQALCGVDDACAQRLVTALEAQYQTMPGIDRLGAELMAEAGIDPLVASWISSLCDGIVVVEITSDGDVDGEGDKRTVAVVDLFNQPQSDRCLTEIEIARGTTWLGNGKLHVPAIPETVRLAVTGGPLHKLVSSGALDAAGLRLDDIETNGATSILHVTGPCHPISARELAALAPCGCR